MTTVHSHLYFAALLLGILAMAPRVPAQIDITALTPHEILGIDRTDIYISAISIVASSLLGDGTAGLLWGSIPGNAVNSVCDNITATGAYSFSVSVQYGSDTISRNMQIQSVGGCGAAGNNAPDGVEAVLQDNEGTISALVCPPQGSSSSGCYLFDTGKDISDAYNGAVSNSNSSGQLAPFGGGGRRKLLDSCPDEGEGAGMGGFVGTVIGLAAQIFICGADLVEMPTLAGFACVGAVTAIGGGAGAGVGIAIACKPAPPTCFPGNALVTTSMGVTLPISQILLGDKVAVRKPHGAIAYSPVYAFGHADPNTTTIFIKLTLHTDTSLVRILTLTPDHLAPTILPDSKQINYKRAKDIHLGDIMFIASNDMKETFTSIVTDVMLTVEQGLYNPFTIEGNIIVDGVVASVHSYWFLDDWFDNLGIPLSLLHEAYQVIMLPVMALYRVLGEKMYYNLYLNIDENFGIATIGTLYGGHIAIGTTITTVFSGLLFLKYATKNLIN